MCKGLMDFLLVICSNLYFTVFEIQPVIDWKTHIHVFPTPSLQPQILKCFPCTASPKFSIPEFMTQGLLLL